MRDLKFICEMWRPCPGYETSYEVSSLGSVRSIDRIAGKRRGVVKSKILKPYINRRGYLEVRLFAQSSSLPRVVHRLVAKAFIDNPNSLPQVNHIDGNKFNNVSDNLEWMNNSENQKHAYKLGLQPSRAGEKNSKAKITDKMLMEHMNKKVDQSQELREARATNKKLMKAIEEKEKQ